MPSQRQEHVIPIRRVGEATASLLIHSKSAKLEVPRLQLLEHPLRIILLADFNQPPLIRLAISRKHVLTSGGIVLIDVPVMHAEFLGGGDGSLDYAPRRTVDLAVVGGAGPLHR